LWQFGITPFIKFSSALNERYNQLGYG